MMRTQTLPRIAVTTLSLAAASLLLPSLARSQSRPLTFPVSDLHGYTAYRSESPAIVECSSSFVDISATGAPVSFTASGADPALDDGGAVLALAAPFELYGRSLTTLVVSTNGYLAASGSLSADSGGDFSGDCPLPAVPDPAPGAPGRLAVLHADLSGADTLGPGVNGVAYTQHFPSCPRPSEAYGGEPCTIVQWQDWAVRGVSGTFSFQAVLYHHSFEVVYQYGAGTPAAGPTVGLQSPDARFGLAPYCPAPTSPLADSALCLFDPRFPTGGPTADLSVELGEKSDFVAAGDPMLYFLSVSNPGPSPMAGVAVSSVIPPELTDCAWTCSAGGGSTCTATGVGAISDSIDLEPDTAATYAMTCTLSLGAGGSSVTVTASATEPTDVTDPDGANNTASVTTEIPIPVTLQRFTVD